MATQEVENNNMSRRLEGPATKGMGKVVPAPAVKGGGRRALGDIGNLVVPQPNNAKGKPSNIQQADKPAVPKSMAAQVDRPITRSFGAQLAGQAIAGAAEQDINHISKPKSNAAAKRTNPNPKPRLPPPVPVANDDKAALAVKKRRGKTLTATLTARSEAACGGFDDVKKVESVEEVIPNIDEQDIGNQLAVIDYVEDIYSFYRRAEPQSCVAPDYISRQTDINEKMRAILVDWLIEVHLKFKLMPETLFLTTNLLDRYLAAKNVSRKSLQLVGMTALLVAAKYEEIWAPEIQDFEFISDNAYSRKQILDTEKIMLNTLRFNLTVPTPYVFLVRFLKAAASTDNQQMDNLAFFYVELCLVDYKMVKFSPSLLAAAAVFTANCALSISPPWNAPLRRHSTYTVAQLGECARQMVELHKNAQEGKLTIVHRKYSMPKHGEVATLSPPTLPTDDEGLLRLFGETKDSVSK